MSLVLEENKKGSGRSYPLYLLPSIIQGCISLALVPVTTNYLNPKDFGIYALIIAMAMPVRAFAASGARWVIGGNYFSADPSERKHMLFNVLVLEFAIRSICVLLMCFVAEPIFRWAIPDYQPEYLGYLWIVLAASLAGSLWPTISFLMSVRNDARTFAGFSLAQILTNATATWLMLAVFGWGVETLFVAMLISATVSLVGEICYVRKLVNCSVQGKWLREAVHTGLKATPGGIAEMVSNMTDRVAIQRWVGLGALGLYSHSQQYLSIFKMLTTALSNTMMKDSLRIYSQDWSPAPIARMLGIWYGFLALAGVWVALFTDDVVAMLTHDKFTGAAPLVQIWFLLVFSVSHGIPYASFLMARKQNKVLMYTQLVPTLISIGLVIVGAYAFGTFGAAWVIVLTNVAIQVSRWVVAQRTGYRGVSERKFVEALVLFIGLWLIDDVLSLGLATEIGICIILVTIVVIRFRLVSEIKYMNSAKLRQEFAK